MILIALPGEEGLMSLSSFCSYKQIMDVGKDSDDKLDLASLDFDCMCLLESFAHV